MSSFIKTFIILRFAIKKKVRVKYSHSSQEVTKIFTNPKSNIQGNMFFTFSY
ncbi:hypothetical protein LEMLEM_LOCUS15064 [Lemmus lemmus]